MVLLALGVLLGGLTLCRRWAAPHPELLRKLLHAGMGLVTLSFPWLFDDVGLSLSSPYSASSCWLRYG